MVNNSTNINQSKQTITSHLKPLNTNKTMKHWDKHKNTSHKNSGIQLVNGIPTLPLVSLDLQRQHRYRQALRDLLPIQNTTHYHKDK